MKWCCLGGGGGVGHVFPWGIVKQDLDGHLVAVAGGVVEWGVATVVSCEGCGTSEVAEEMGYTAVCVCVCVCEGVGECSACV